MNQVDFNVGLWNAAVSYAAVYSQLSGRIT